MSENEFVQVGTDTNFNDLVIEASKSRPILVDFWAPWCGPCRMLTPLLETIADERKGSFTLIKVNTDENPTLSQAFQIRSIPTVMAFVGGEVVDKFMGAQGRATIETMLDALVPSEGAKAKDEAKQLFDTGAVEEAVDAYRRALSQGSADSEILLGLGRALLEMKAFDDAEESFREIEVGEAGYDEAKGLLGVVGLHRLAGASDELRTLESQISEDPKNVEAHYALGAKRFVEGELTAALDSFLEVVRQDRKFNDDAGRKAMLAIFQSIGNRSKISDDYRKKLSRTLY